MNDDDIDRGGWVVCPQPVPYAGCPQPVVPVDETTTTTTVEVTASTVTTVEVVEVSAAAVPRVELPVTGDGTMLLGSVGVLLVAVGGWLTRR